MSESPEDDTASKATERGKTSASQMLGKQMEAKSRWKKRREAAEGSEVGRNGKPNTQKEALHNAPR